MRSIEQHGHDYDRIVEENPLRLARKAAGLSLASVAGMLGVTIQSVHWWEKGSSRPNEKNMGLLSAFLDIDQDELEAAWDDWLEQLQ